MRHLCVVLASLTVLVACRADRSARGEEAVAASTRFAFSLEDSAATHRAELRTREALLALFEQGFEPAVAARLTERLWDAEHQ